MLTKWAGSQIQGPNDALALSLVMIILIIGAPVIALILNGFRRNYDKIESDQREAWESHIKSAHKELRLRDERPVDHKSLDDWGFWTLENPPDIQYK